MITDLDSANNTEHNRSGSYNLINTDDVLSKLTDTGWTIASASEKMVRVMENIGKQFHIIKLEHPDLYVGDDPINLVFSNSHDGKNAAKFRLGLFRMVCSNGLVAGDELVPSISVPHAQKQISKAIDMVINYMISKASDMHEVVQVMQKTKLLEDQKKQLAREALMIKGFKDVNDFQIDSVLIANRPEDEGDDLWRTYNTVQESIENGLYMLDEAGKGRVIKSEVKKLDFNTKLFDTAVRLAA